MRRRALALALLGSLAGCSLAPPLERPAVDVPAAWQETLPPVEGRWREAAPADAAGRRHA